MLDDRGNWTLTEPQRRLARWMLDRAALLGVRGFGRVEPNPMVGCVIARTLADDAQMPSDPASLILGRGYHKVFGGLHAEAEAIADARAAGHDLRGATAYVTLEPCNAKGRNPACVDGLLQAGITRVVYARRDPHPIGLGSKAGGAARLMQAGVKVALTTVSPAATALAEAFVTRTSRTDAQGRLARPYTIVKWAQSLDGRMTTSTGASKWITGPVSRRYAHRLRGSCDVIVTSGRVIVRDDAQMDARGVVVRRVAARVVLDGQGELVREVVRRIDCGEPQLRLVQSIERGEGGPVVVVLGAGARRDEIDERGAEELRRRGVFVIDGSIWTQRDSEGEPRYFDLLCVLEQLSSGAWWGRADQQVSQIMFEAGPLMTSSLLQAGLADETWVFIANRFLGGQGATGPMELASIDQPAEASAWRCVLRKTCGGDQLVILRPERRQSGSE